MILAIWLLMGCAGFFFARAALQDFSCNPITYATLLFMLLCIGLGPINIFAGIIWTLCFIGHGGGFDWLHKEIVNPCKWFRKKPN